MSSSAALMLATRMATATTTRAATAHRAPVVGKRFMSGHGTVEENLGALGVMPSTGGRGHWVLVIHEPPADRGGTATLAFCACRTWLYLRQMCWRQ